MAAVSDDNNPDMLADSLDPEKMRRLVHEPPEVTISLTPVMLAQVDAAAEVAGCSRSEWVRCVISAALAPERTKRPDARVSADAGGVGRAEC